MGSPSPGEEQVESSRAQPASDRVGGREKQERSFKQVIEHGFRALKGAKFLRILLDPATTSSKDEDGGQPYPQD
ncbi:hypothetical protein SUGI_0215440 [Cryptomeria japonica]|nr:hypothetical protein SUGI_0215440 [Cryptomeria japonica]